MRQENLPGYIQYLMDAGSYPHRATDVRLLQTHISYVVLAGEFVYKWKKPVNLGFLDFSNLENRRYFCEQELTLNRRLCPEVYLDVVQIARQDDSFCLSGAGEVVEYGVRMARLPEDRMMGALMGRGALGRNEIDRIVDRLVPFYAQAEKFTRGSGYGSAEAVAENVLENLKQLAPFVDNDILGQRQFVSIREYSEGFLQREELFLRRLDAGRIRDCHGDLHSGNICLRDAVCIFDCIEFSNRLRCGDVAADVAFLAMDLDLHGLVALSEYFVERFTCCSGDVGLVDMLDFYKCYRACVRGKINLLTAVDPGVDAATAVRCRRLAKRCLALAESYLPEA